MVESGCDVEFLCRGLYHGLLVGVMIAIASGGGVALAVLGGNTASLVGTAISASLLPPAVNAVSFLKMEELFSALLFYATLVVNLTLL